MRVSYTATARSMRWFPILLILCCFSAGPDVAAVGVATAQGAESPPQKSAAARDDAKVAEGEQAADAALAAQQGGESEDEKDAGSQGGATDAGAGKKIRILELLFAGGYLMLPIAAMSILVVTFLVERWLGLRRRRVLPSKLIRGLGTMAGQKGGFDPRRAYKLCQQFPSSAANVIKTMLLKVGRPLTEVEHAVSEANNREAARLYANVRWLSLAAGVTPLMGLLGTVWGMINAFFVTANLPIGANKAQHLADGIYIALVTTFAGLSVAIPAAIAAHLFEGRIQKLFRELDETLLGLMPQLERFEGRLRVSKEMVEVSPADGSPSGRSAHPQPAPAPK